MARSKRRRRRKQDWRQILFYILSALVAISMAIGYVVLVASPR